MEIFEGHDGKAGFLYEMDKSNDGVCLIVRYRVRFNSHETDWFITTRGLRQGDPLSPYLYLICTEGLSSLLLHADEEGNLAGIKVCRDALSVSHLLFTDDSLILMKANEDNVRCLHDILDSYYASSGQMVSVGKSSIYFSPNTHVDVRAEICTILDIMMEAILDKYLGLPSIVGADRSDHFKYLVERIIKLINGWKNKTLSMAGKETLLKAVA
jgi:hypothetical protein